MLSVLLVDDEQMLLDATRLFLERFGEMTVTTASSATEALAVLAGNSFDAMVVDYDMPGISGIEFLKIIRAKGDTTPVIIFTGVGREHAAIEALNNGADFFIQKGDEPNTQLRDMVTRIRQSVEKRIVGTGLGTTQKVLADTVNFFPTPAYALDRDGVVIAWNEALSSFTGRPAQDILGKNREYSQLILGRKAPLPTDLIFQPEEELPRYRYTLIFRDRSTIIAWTRAKSADGGDLVLWMKAHALFDSKGTFVAVLGAVRDITGEIGEELLRQQEVVPDEKPALATATAVGMFGRILGKGKSQHKDGLRLYYREGKCREAIQLFNTAIETDPAFVYAWHDRGVCYRELGMENEALRDFEKAVQLDPANEEVLLSYADMLKRLGLLQGQAGVIAQAIQVYNKIVEKNPSNAAAWNSLGVCMKESGKAELSRQYFERARDLKRAGKDRKNVRDLELIV